MSRTACLVSPLLLKGNCFDLYIDKLLTASLDKTQTNKAAYVICLINPLKKHGGKVT